MSIENFLNDRLPEAELVHLMQRKAEHKFQSRIHVFLDEFIAEGRDGLRSTGKKLSDRDIELYRNGRTSAPISQAEKESLIINHTGILFGLSGISIESVLVEQVFDVNEFCGLYEESLRETPLPRFFHPVSGGLERLTTDRWREMITLADKDKTLAIFFEPEGFGALPENLQVILRGMEALPIIQEHILPEYKIRAASLVTSQPLTN